MDRGGTGNDASMAQKSGGRVGGIPVQLSHLDKVFFPDDGITKGDLVAYYESMAPRIIGYLKDRPLVMDRYPDGITGQRLVQKNVPRYFPDWITRAEVKKQGGVVRHVICDKPATLVYLANQACIELHVFLSSLAALDRPDQLVFDLDPPDEAGFGLARRHALNLRELLEGDLRARHLRQDHRRQGPARARAAAPRGRLRHGARLRPRRGYPAGQPVPR